VKIVSRLLLCGALAGAGFGCASSGPSHLAVTLDKTWLYRAETLPSVEVDIVGVRESERHLWETYSMTRYWQPDDRLRAQGDKITLRFGHGRPISQRLAAEHPTWRQWRRSGVSALFILADLPGAYSDIPGVSDPRRQILPFRETSGSVEVVIRPHK
jgi:hypothetical protein